MSEFEFDNTPSNVLVEKKTMGRPKKEAPLRNKQVSTYLSEDELKKLNKKTGDVPNSIALRQAVLKLIED